jgi:hypothetical protein
MNSLEAKKISFSAADKEINDIIDQIKKAANDKKTQITISEISQAAVGYFASNGFEIMSLTNPGRNILECTISWS